MGSPFLYRLRVEWRKNGATGKELIPVYAFKGGGKESLFPGEIHNLESLKMITTGADGARVLTVCTFSLYAYRALENREIDYFELHIKDTRIKTNPTEERRTVATITCRDMTAGEKFPVDRNHTKMSCEPVGNHLTAVSLSFFDFDGGPQFQRV